MRPIEFAEQDLRPGAAEGTSIDFRRQELQACGRQVSSKYHIGHLTMVRGRSNGGVVGGVGRVLQLGS